MKINFFTADMLLAIQLTSHFVTCVISRVAWCRIAAFWRGGSVEGRSVGWGGVKICGSVTNKLWGWGEWVLCSWSARFSCILRLALMYNLIRFTDICLKLSLKIIPAKHDTPLYHVMTRSLIWTACTAVALWICAHWVQSITPDIAIQFFSHFWK